MIEVHTHIHDIYDKIHSHTKQDSCEMKELLFAFYKDLMVCYRSD